MRRAGGGLFFRVISAPGTVGFNAVGFVASTTPGTRPAPGTRRTTSGGTGTAAGPGLGLGLDLGLDAGLDGLAFPRVTSANLLRDGPASSPQNEGADPRAAHRALTGMYYVTTQSPGKSCCCCRCCYDC